MKKFAALILMALFAMLPFALFGQDVSPSPVPSALSISSLGDLFNAASMIFHAMGGKSPLVIMAAVIQAIMLVLNGTLGNLAGKYKILLVAGLSVVAAIVGGLVNGEGILAMISDASVLATMQVFVHQVITQISEPTANA